MARPEHAVALAVPTGQSSEVLVSKMIGFIATALLAAACGGEMAEAPLTSISDTLPAVTSGTEAGEEVGAPLAIVANSSGTLVPGEVRPIIALLDSEGLTIASPDLDVTVDLLDPQTGELVTSVVPDFVWMIPESRGMFVARFDVDRPGLWGIVANAQGYPPSDAMGVLVNDVAMIPVVGDVAPPSVTPTGAEFDLVDITTASEPNPAFYESSLHEVLGKGLPVVVVFATPALCTSAACGPMLEVVEEVWAATEDAEFIHVEVYTNLHATSTEELELAPAIIDWGLPSEPWVFVADGDGIVTASFEGSLGLEELIASIEAAR